jgi:hypothetical protein
MADLEAEVTACIVAALGDDNAARQAAEQQLSQLKQQFPGTFSTLF